MMIMKRMQQREKKRGGKEKGGRGRGKRGRERRGKGGKKGEGMLQIYPERCMWQGRL